MHNPLKVYIVSRKNPQRYEIAHIVLMATDPETARQAAKERAESQYEFFRCADDFVQPSKSTVREVPSRNKEIIWVNRY